MRAIELRETRIELIRVLPGSFLMGSPNVFFSEAPVHRVTIAYPFCLSKFPITQQQWQQVMSTNPSRFSSSGDHPVDSISWSEADRYCRNLSEHIGRQVRLPSESEWEYACRADTSGDFFFDPAGPFTDDSSLPSNVRHGLLDFAWFDMNSRDKTHPVGLKRPNPWGFYDMIGNVWEWCGDHWHGDYDGAPSDGSAWIERADSRRHRCLRGGAWNMDAFRCRSPYRSWDHEALGTDRFGVRIWVQAEP